MNLIRNIQIVLALLFITTCSVTCTDFRTVRDRIEIVNITARESIPIIRVSVGGEEYVFLVDSQSPVSFIDSAVVKNKNLKVEEIKPHQLMLVTGDKNNRTRAVIIMDNRFYVHNFKKTKKSVEWHTGLSIDGIIGNDMLYNNRATLDLQKVILDKLKQSN